MRENASGNMDLTQSTWMVRDLEQAASDVLLLEDDSVIAGGWDGAIKYWSAEGDTIWGIETPNRISCLTIEADKLYATSGLHLLKIDLKTGNIDWQIVHGRYRSRLDRNFGLSVGRSLHSDAQSSCGSCWPAY